MEVSNVFSRLMSTVNPVLMGDNHKRNVCVTGKSEKYKIYAFRKGTAS